MTVNTPAPVPIPASVSSIAQLPTKFAGLAVHQPTAIQQHRGTCISLSGAGGVGKTTLAHEVINSPIIERVLFVDIEGGAHVLDDEEYTRQGYLPEEGPKLGIVQPTNWMELERIMQALVRDPAPFNCAIWDNMSEALEMAKASKAFYANEADQLGKWNTITNMMVELFRQGRDMARARRFVTIYCMWDTTEHEDEMGVKFKHRGLHFNPKLAEKFMGIVDLVGWLETPNKPAKPYPPILHFDKDPLWPTKMRVSPRTRSLSNIPDVHYNPSLADIIDTLMDGKPFPTAKHASPVRERPT